MSGRVAVVDKPELERLYMRLADECELKERVESLDRKLAVIGEAAKALTDMIDTRRSLRLEWAIVMLIVFSIIITLYAIFARSNGANRPLQTRIDRMKIFDTPWISDDRG